MRRVLKNIMREPIVKQSAFMFASSVFVNITNLVFWFYMVRKLSTEDYGELNSLVSFLMLFSVPLGILQTVITRYVSKFMAHDRKEDIQRLVLYFSKILAVCLAFLFLLFVFFGRGFALFLRIYETRPIYLIGCGIIFASSASITIGTLFGLQKFNAAALNSVLTGLTKLGAGFSLVAMGARVFGALLGFVLSFLASFVVSLFQLPSWLRILKEKAPRHLPDKKEILRYFLPVGLSTLCFFILTNIDIILVKHFFNATDAGFYSVAQMVGRIILFVPGAIGVVMFPKIVENHTKRMDTLPILKKCLSAVGALCGVCAIFALMFPGLILRLLTGQTHPQSVALVKYFAFSMTFFAQVNILMLYHLSIRNIGYVACLCAVSLLQIIGIWFLHFTMQHVLVILSFTSVFLFSAGFWLAQKDAHERS